MAVVAEIKKGKRKGYHLAGPTVTGRNINTYVMRVRSTRYGRAGDTRRPRRMSDNRRPDPAYARYAFRTRNNEIVFIVRPRIGFSPRLSGATGAF